MITIIYGTRNVFERRPILTINSFKSISELEGEYEVIVADYGSTDTIMEACEKFGFTYLPTEVEEDVDFCIAKCYNHGIYEAEGDIILPLGTDMILSEDTIKLIEENFAKDEYGGDIIGLIQVFHWEEESKKLFPMRSDWRWIPVYRKKTALFGGGYDERFKVWGHEDVDFIARMNERIKLQQVFFESILCLHQWHGKEHSEAIEFQEGGNPNSVVFDENRLNNSKNMVNSYW